MDSMMGKCGSRVLTLDPCELSEVGILDPREKTGGGVWLSAGNADMGFEILRGKPEGAICRYRCI